MGLLINLTRDYLKDVGGYAKAVYEANNWFKEAKNNSKDTTLVKTSESFKNGKIYIFKYDALTKDRNRDWDKNPLVLSLGQDEHGNDLGINLNYLSNRLCTKILDRIMDNYSSVIKSAIRGRNKGNAKLQQPLDSLNYDNLVRILNGLNYNGAIRSYINGRKREQYVFSYDVWPQISFLNKLSKKSHSS